MLWMGWAASGRAQSPAELPFAAMPEPTFVVEGGLPESPQPQQATPQQPENGQQNGGSSSSLPQDTTPINGAEGRPVTAPQSQRDLAEEQIKRQEKQRVMGVLPSFNISYNSEAVSLTRKQKFELAWKSVTDPVSFGTAGFVALIAQAEGSPYEYGGGWGGYAKRYGSSYADSFDGAMLGNALLPSLLHQDPRYFRRGYGSAKRRIEFAMATGVICKHDNTGKWEPNYSNVLGNLAAGGISNLYAPEEERGWESTFSSFAVVMAEGAAGSIFQEFWPDLSRKFFHRDPTNGQDAINRARHAAR